MGWRQVSREEKERKKRERKREDAKNVLEAG